MQQAQVLFTDCRGCHLRLLSSSLSRETVAKSGGSLYRMMHLGHSALPTYSSADDLRSSRLRNFPGSSRIVSAISAHDLKSSI